MGAGGASVCESLFAVTSAGAGRPPEPKNASTLVSQPSTGPRSAAAKMLSGRLSSASGACATDSVCVAAS